MAPQLDAVQLILIKSLLKELLKTKLIASEASCSVRAVQRIRLKRQQFEMPGTPRENRVGRRSCITSPIQGALCDKIIEQPYLYRCKMADFLYRRYGKRISERSKLDDGYTFRATLAESATYDHSTTPNCQICHSRCM
jgi:hypothetical protein